MKIRNFLLIGAVCILQACGDSRYTSSSTNVLNRQQTGSSVSTGKKRMSAEEMRQAAKNYKKPEPSKMPEQIITPKKVEKEEISVYIAPKIDRPIDNTELEKPTDMSFKSPQYYQYQTDSLQKDVKNTYFSTLDELIKSLGQVPSSANNPAINSKWYASPNFNLRKPTYVIIHHTAQSSKEQTYFTFSLSRTQVSSHYVIGRDGSVAQLVNDYLRTWHAGNSKWGSNEDLNSVSLGIELDNNGNEPFSDSLINSLITLLSHLKKTYGISVANFIGHSDIAPSRKNDPSKYFPWKKLADAGFGYWYDTNNLPSPPPDFNAAMALRIIGYNTKNLENAIQAFKLHYIQTNTNGTLSDYDNKVLYAIYLQAL